MGEVQRPKDGSYYAKDGFVWKAPVETKNADGSSTFLIGFRVCRMMPEVGDEAAELVAGLMTAGEAALRQQIEPDPTPSPQRGRT